MNSNWSYSPEAFNSGQNRWFSVPFGLEIWWMTLKNNRTPLLCYFKLCASFQSDMNSNWRYSPETAQLDFDHCDFDLWPLTLKFCMNILSLVITSGNVIMIWWWKHSKKCVTDRQTDGRTDSSALRAAWSQIKKYNNALLFCLLYIIYKKTTGINNPP